MIQLAVALMPFLISPETQPNGFVIADFPVAASFINPDTFKVVEAGLLGSNHLLRASRSGGLGSSCFDGPGGRWVGYWHDQAALMESVPKNALRTEENGELDKMSTELRGFLGYLAGPAPGQQPTPASVATIAAPTGTMGPVSISMSAMQPIKIGAKGKGVEEGFVAPPKGMLQDEDEPIDANGQDSVLLSRSELRVLWQVWN